MCVCVCMKVKVESSSCQPGGGMWLLADPTILTYYVHVTTV